MQGSTPNPRAHLQALRFGLFVRLNQLGVLSAIFFAFAYALLGLRILSVFQVAFAAEVLGMLAWIKLRPNTGIATVAVIQSLCVFGLLAVNTVVLGGFVGSGGFALWAYVPPVAAMFLLDGRPRRALLAFSLLFLVAITVVEPWLVPFERFPRGMIPILFAANILGSGVVLLGSLAYFQGEVLAQHEALAASERQQRSLLMGIPLGIALKDSTGGYRFVNGAFASGVGASPDALNRLREADGAARESPIPVVREDEVELGGLLRRLRSTRLWLEEPGGEPLLCWVVEDITERARAREQGERTRQLESLGTLAGGIAHDFNNLLMAMQGHLSLSVVQEEPRLSAERVRALELAILRARELSLRILTFADGGAPSRALTSVRAVIEEAAAFALLGTAVRLSVEIEETLPEAQLDAGQIGRVIHNLVLNAAQAMPAGGSVRVRAGAAQAPASLLDAPGSPVDGGVSMLRIQVADDGPGVPLELRSRIFDPFFTTKTAGSGFGLPTCDSIVRQHDGAIVLESVPGRGATFSVYLPVAADAPSVAVPVEPVPLEGGVVPRRPRRVLVMDDDDDVRDVVVGLLLHLGHSVDACADGDAAVARSVERLGGPLAYDMVLLDLTVQGGLGGREAAKRIRAQDPAVILVAASGYADDRTLSALAAHGFDKALRKPFTLAQLAAVVNRGRE